MSATPVRTLKIRARKPTCPACNPSDRHQLSPQARWSAFVAAGDGLWPGWEDPLCSLPGVGKRAAAGEDELRLSPTEFNASRQARRCTLIDTRSETEFELVHVEGSLSECPTATRPLRAIDC